MQECDPHVTSLFISYKDYVNLQYRFNLILLQINILVGYVPIKRYTALLSISIIIKLKRGKFNRYRIECISIESEIKSGRDATGN